MLPARVHEHGPFERPQDLEGRALVRLKLGARWLDKGSLIRLLPHSVPSPHAHYLCWRTGAMDRWECNAFAQWLRQAVL